MSDCMFIEETIQKVSLFTTEEDLRVYMKEYVYRENHTYWTRTTKLEKDTVSVICLCNWKSYNSSLRIYLADDGEKEYLRSTKVVQPGHLHISVYAKRRVPTMLELSKEYMSAYRFSTEYLSTHSYFTGNDLYPIQPTMQYLTNEYGNSYRSCTQPAHTLNRPPGLGHPQTYITLPPSRERQTRGIRGRFRSRTFSRR